MKSIPRALIGVLLATCLLALAQSSLAIEGMFVAANSIKRMAELEPDPAKKAQMLKAAELTAESMEIKGDVLVSRNGALTTRYNVTDHRPFLLGTVNYPDGTTGYCSVYIKDEDTLIVGSKKFSRSK